MVACLVQVAKPGVGMADPQVSVGLALLVSGCRGGGQGGAVSADEILPVPLPLEECQQRMRKLPGMSVVAGISGQLDGG